MIKNIVEKSNEKILDAKKLLSDLKKNPYGNNQKFLNRKRRQDNKHEKDELNNNSLKNKHKQEIIENLNINQTNKSNFNIVNNFYTLENNPLIKLNNNNLNNSEKQVIKFNNRVYPFNSSNLNFSNNKTNTEDGDSIKEKTPQNNLNDENKNIKMYIQVQDQSQDYIQDQEEFNTLKISDLLMDNIISELKNIKDDSNLKNYLKNRISNIIRKFNFI